MDEKTKQELLKELEKEYNVILKPKKDPIFSVKGIIDEYMPKICEKSGVENSWGYANSFSNAIRKTVCMKFGINSVRDVPMEKRKDFEIELIKLIKNYILEEK